ncbi:MAG: CDP-alcohol phosphatidyltransferase family protein [Nitrospirota bacterium]|nr:CDP-alcohol phosphatidyltransferase family protein [Nitrospirota bacterium]
MRVFNLPNTITITRIIIIPVFTTAIIYYRYDYALYLFIIASVSDFLDGLIARVKDQKTMLGTFLDPLADKFLLVTTFILFAIYGLIPKWVAITVISRDLIVLTGWFLLYMITHNSKVEPVIMGKIAIASQMITLTYILLTVNIRPLPPVPDILLFFTAMVTALSGLQYIYKGFKLTNAL